ncbi:hypothetical protein FOA52_012304 [Chlamydomonas sp. UWO 241]|nr:hypothetical protein FOA52_012304 [Chlamydomonas sp. UWO 241]
MCNTTLSRGGSGRGRRGGRAGAGLSSKPPERTPAVEAARKCMEEATIKVMEKTTGFAPEQEA